MRWILCLTPQTVFSTALKRPRKTAMKDVNTFPNTKKVYSYHEVSAQTVAHGKTQARKNASAEANGK
jgi:hypothetical protein